MALHVAAKRVLVTEDPTYFARLSADSVRSLALQGGPMSAMDCAHFHAHPFAQDALWLRRCDERAKSTSAIASVNARREESLMRLVGLINAVLRPR